MQHTGLSTARQLDFGP